MSELPCGYVNPLHGGRCNRQPEDAVHAIHTYEVEERRRGADRRAARAAQPESAGPLDVAWAEAEAALPAGWSNGPTLFGYDVQGGGRFYVATADRPRPYARARRVMYSGEADTPAAALRALAARLTAEKPPEHGIGGTE